MDILHYQQQQLYLEGRPLAELAAEFGTPCYVYSKAALTRAWQNFAQAFASRPNTRICYAVKANSNLAILNLFAKLGAGFDIVSGGELQRVLAAGGDPRKVVFSGVGKTEAEIRQALTLGIFCFNVESAPELYRINHVASELGCRAPMSLRVNPNVDAQTHPYISTGLKENKFGIPAEEAVSLYKQAAKLSHIDILGIDCHIGSQLTDTAPFVDALDKILLLVDELNALGIELKHIDVGGGVGIQYLDESPPKISDYAQKLMERLANYPQHLVLEPGRALVGNAGILLTKIEYLKRGESKNFAIVDAAMNDLMRPALYEAYHGVLPVVLRQRTSERFDIVGPVCETGDFLAQGRDLAVEPHDLLAICSAGAYGMAMSSNYNTRARAAEIMVDGEACYLIRTRESLEQLYALEHLLP